MDESARGSVAARARALARVEGLFAGGGPALVMVSGGQDSVALLHLLATGALAEAGPARMFALHVNHSLRGEESEADETLVRALCGGLGVELEVRRAPVDRERGNLQERARDLRREAAGETAARLGAARVALGHTLDDQVETLLYRMGRYGGLRSFAGMLAHDPPWVRPLLGTRRSETEAYCREHGLAFAVDRGNLYPGYARTALRHSVLPAWEEALPGAAEAAARTAAVAAELVRLVEVLIDRAEEEARPHGKAPAPTWSAARLLAQPPALRRALLHRLLGRLSGVEGSRQQVLALESLLAKGGTGRLSLGGGWTVVNTYGQLSFERHASPPGDARHAVCAPPVLPLPLGVRVSWGRLVVSAEAVEAFAAPDVSREVYVDADQLQWPLEVRSHRPGDRFRPLGASGGRPLKEVFIDLRVPASLRAQVPLVVSAGQVLWVGGYALAQQGRILPGTQRVARLAIEEGDVRAG